MKIFNIDFHISGMLDLRAIFENLGHSLKDVSLSGHNFVLDRKQGTVPMLDNDNWNGLIERKLWNSFHDAYHSQLDKYDCFLTFYPPIFSMLYKNFNKPIIVVVPIRYEYGADCNEKDWAVLNEYLQRDNVYLVANNLYDKHYTENWVDKTVEYIPSICDYTGMYYTGGNDRHLYYSQQKESSVSSKFLYKHDVLKGGHSWVDLCQFKTITHFPYNCSTMSFFEHYAAGIPMFIPTLDYSMRLYEQEYKIWGQLGWPITCNRPAGSLLPGNNKYDPNDYLDSDAMRYWLRYSDFYNDVEFSNLNYFGSMEELNEIVDIYDLEKISKLMQIQNVIRKRRVYDKWENLLTSIEKGHR